MEMTIQEKQLLRLMLEQTNFADAEMKIVAGQFQLKVEASLAENQTQSSPDTTAPDSS